MTLIFDAISASYHKKLVLNSVSFPVHAGEMTALIGQNGAGKSTLLRILTGEKKDYTGSILLDGKDIRTMTPHRRALTFSYLPQLLPQPHVTVGELVSFGRTPYTPFSGRLSDADLSCIADALKTVGMEQYRDAYLDVLSGGEQKKAYFAMILAQNTPFLILDEPTAHLDTSTRFDFLSSLQALCHQTGKTVLIIMHELADILRYADRIAVLHDQRIAFFGTPDECLTQEIPQTCFRIRISGDALEGYRVTPVSYCSSQPESNSIVPL